MAFKLFDFLDWKISPKVSLMSEKKFVFEHEEILSYFGYLNKFVFGPEPFAIIKKSIIIQAYLNKKQIEDETELYSETELATEERLLIIHDRLPSFTYNDVNIYVPFFSPAFNKRYDTKVNSLTKFPFILLRKDFEAEVIDPFETYSMALFNSPFSHLIYLMEDQSCAAYYHAELKMVFVINKQGTLDHYIPLFDDFIEHPDYADIFKRLKDTLTYYFKYDREGFIDSLWRNGFISEYIYNEIQTNTYKRSLSRGRRIKAANGK